MSWSTDEIEIEDARVEVTKEYRTVIAFEGNKTIKPTKVQIHPSLVLFQESAKRYNQIFFVQPTAGNKMQTAMISKKPFEAEEKKLAGVMWDALKIM